MYVYVALVSMCMCACEIVFVSVIYYTQVWTHCRLLDSVDPVDPVDPAATVDPVNLSTLRLTVVDTTQACVRG